MMQMICKTLLNLVFSRSNASHWAGGAIHERSLLDAVPYAFRTLYQQLQQERRIQSDARVVTNY